MEDFKELKKGQKWVLNLEDDQLLIELEYIFKINKEDLYLYRYFFSFYSVNEVYSWKNIVASSMELEIGRFFLEDLAYRGLKVNANAQIKSKIDEIWSLVTKLDKMVELDIAGQCFKETLLK